LDDLDARSGGSSTVAGAVEIAGQWLSGRRLDRRGRVIVGPCNLALRSHHSADVEIGNESYPSDTFRRRIDVVCLQSLR
jgi:hypothetical protein